MSPLRIVDRSMDGLNMRIKLYFKVLLCVMVVIATIIAGVAKGEDCQSDLLGLEIECLYYMHKGVPSIMQNPNHRCCRAIKKSNIPCVCTKLTHKISKYNMLKLGLSYFFVSYFLSFFRSEPRFLKMIAVSFRI